MLKNVVERKMQKMSVLKAASPYNQKTHSAVDMTPGCRRGHLCIDAET